MHAHIIIWILQQLLLANYVFNILVLLNSIYMKSIEQRVYF